MSYELENVILSPIALNFLLTLVKLYPAVLFVLFVWFITGVLSIDVPAKGECREILPLVRSKEVWLVSDIVLF